MDGFKNVRTRLGDPTPVNFDLQKIATARIAKEAQAKNGKVKCRPAYGPLLTTLSDPVESVRKQATRALASLSSRLIRCATMRRVNLGFVMM